MTIATGVAKRLALKAESTWGTAAGASGAQIMRRVTSDLSITKETYESNELRSDYQVADFRHGVRKAEGTIKGELSPATWQWAIEAACRKIFASVAAITGASITIAGSGPTYTVTRGAGSYLTDGFKIGDVMRLSVGAFNAANLLQNLLIVNLTATIATVVVVSGSALAAEGPIATSTATVIGKKTYVPLVGHTDPSYSVEHWHADISQSELFLGCKINTIAFGLPASGMATIDVGLLGKDVTPGTAAYYSGPTAANSNGLLCAISGVIRYGSGKVANITGLTLNYSGGMQTKPVVGSNTVPDIFEGRSMWEGQFTALFEDATYRDAFLNETVASITVVLTTNASSGIADFVAITMSNIKLNSSQKSDGETGLEQTVSFKALLNNSGGTGTANEQSTIVFQDSLAA